MEENTPQDALFAEVRIVSGSGPIGKLEVSGGAENVKDQETLSNTCPSIEE